MSLDARLNKLERSLLEPAKRGRVFRVIASQGDEVAARKLIEAEGFDPEAGDLAIFRIIVSPAGQPPYTKPPYILERGCR